MKIACKNIVISGFMVELLNLKGNELILYSIIYTFTQDGQWHSSRLSYIQRWIPISAQGISWLVADLKKKGLIEVQRRGRTNWYRVCQEPLDRYAETMAKEEEEGKRKKAERGPSPWEKALEKARGKAPEGEAAGEGKAEDLKALGDELRSFDPYGFGKED